MCTKNQTENSEQHPHSFTMSVSTRNFYFNNTKSGTLEYGQVGPGVSANKANAVPVVTRTRCYLMFAFE